MQTQGWDAQTRAGCRDKGGMRRPGWDKGLSRHAARLREVFHQTPAASFLSAQTHNFASSQWSLGPFVSASRQRPTPLTKLESISAGKQQWAPELSWRLTWKRAIAHKAYFLLWTAEGHAEIQHCCYCNYWDLKNRFITSSTGVMGGYGSHVFGFTYFWCSSLDQADLFPFLVHSSFVPICLAGSVWEEHLPLQHHFAPADLQEP